MRMEYVIQESTNPVIQSRLAWFREYQSLGNAKRTCERFGISRKTFYKWLKRFKTSGGNVSSLVDLPRTPHHSPRRTSDTVRSQVVELRLSTGYGPRRIGRLLSERMGVRLSERTIWKILKNTSGYVRETTHHQSATETIEAEASIAA